MSTENVEVFNKYYGNGVATQFSIGFPYLKREYVKVYLYRGKTSEEVKLNTNQFSFVNDATIQFPVLDTDDVLQEGDILTIQRETTLGSEFEFDNQRRLFPVEVMNADDLAFQQIQELYREVNRSVRVNPTANETPEELLNTVYEKLDSATEIAGDAINAANQAQTAADNATAAVNQAEQTLTEVTNYVDTAKSDIEDAKNTAISTINNTVLNAKADINTAVDEATMNITDIVSDAEGSITNIAVTEANKAIANAAQEATDTATANLNSYVDGTVKPSLQTYVDQAQEDANSAATSMEQAALSATAASNYASNASADADNAAESATHAATSATDSEHYSEDSRIWAEGTDSEVTALGGVHSSKVWSEIVEGAITTIEGAIGDIGFAPLGIDETQNKRRYLNGQVISQSQFATFTDKVKSAVALYPSLSATETNWQAEVTNSKLGQCGKFVIDDTAGTIRLPKVVNINGLIDLSALGGIKAESLPNITGEFGAGSGQWVSGAFTTLGNTEAYAGSTVGDGRTRVEFDASRSSSTYQDGAKVQQEAIQYPYFIQVATGSEESVDISTEIQLNNPFFFGMHIWSDTAISNASWLISNGSYHSGATYVDFYEWLLKIHNGTLTVDGVSVKAYGASDITDYDYVINTADTTFRLPVKVKLASGNAVAGNGMTLGLTNGSYQYGLMGDTNANILYEEKVYGESVGSSSGGSHLLRGSLGITTDPTKSGIETSSSGLKLYFYVGETIQDANVINAAGVLTRVSNSIDRTIASDRETVVGWGMPDYSAKLELSISQGSTYIPPTDGCLAIYLGSTGSSCEITLNNSSGVRVFIGTLTGENLLENKIPVIKGEKYYFNKYSGNFKNVYFFPLKGVN